MIDDDIPPRSDLERLLTSRNEPGLSASAKARHRELLSRAIDADRTERSGVSLQRRRSLRRRRTIGAASVAAALVATGGGLAVARLTHQEPSITNLVRCFALPTTAFEDASVGVDASYMSGPSGDTTGTAAAALDVCGTMWAIGELSAKPPHVTTTVDETYSRPVPLLQACVLPAGNVGVFPGERDVCDRLGLPRADVT